MTQAEANKKYRSVHRLSYNKASLRRYHWRMISKEFRMIGISDYTERRGSRPKSLGN